VVVGGAALAGTIDSTSVKMAEKARIALFEEEGEHSTSETEGTVAPVETDTEEPVTTNTETETETPDN